MVLGASSSPARSLLRGSQTQQGFFRYWHVRGKIFHGAEGRERPRYYRQSVSYFGSSTMLSEGPGPDCGRRLQARSEAFSTWLMSDSPG